MHQPAAISQKLISFASRSLSDHFDPGANRTKPMMDATKPPNSIHTALSVGEPVKNWETSEPRESDALTPKMMRTIPPPRSASETVLFMDSYFISSGWLRNLPQPARSIWFLNGQVLLPLLRRLTLFPALVLHGLPAGFHSGQDLCFLATNHFL